MVVADRLIASFIANHLGLSSFLEWCFPNCEGSIAEEDFFTMLQSTSEFESAPREFLRACLTRLVAERYLVPEKAAAAALAQRKQAVAGMGEPAATTVVSVDSGVTRYALGSMGYTILGQGIVGLAPPRSEKASLPDIHSEIQRAIELLQVVLRKAGQPPDNVRSMQSWLPVYPEVGDKDRRAVRAIILGFEQWLGERKIDFEDLRSKLEDLREKLRRAP